jgi:hypothetical protein
MMQKTIVDAPAEMKPMLGAGRMLFLSIRPSGYDLGD